MERDAAEERRREAERVAVAEGQALWRRQREERRLQQLREQRESARRSCRRCWPATRRGGAPAAARPTPTACACASCTCTSCTPTATRGGRRWWRRRCASARGRRAAAAPGCAATRSCTSRPTSPAAAAWTTCCATASPWSSSSRTGGSSTRWWRSGGASASWSCATARSASACGRRCGRRGGGRGLEACCGATPAPSASGSSSLWDTRTRLLCVLCRPAATPWRIWWMARRASSWCRCWRAAARPPPSATRSPAPTLRAPAAAPRPLPGWTGEQRPRRAPIRLSSRSRFQASSSTYSGCARRMRRAAGATSPRGRRCGGGRATAPPARTPCAATWTTCCANSPLREPPPSLSTLHAHVFRDPPLFLSAHSPTAPPIDWNCPRWP